MDVTETPTPAQLRNAVDAAMRRQAGSAEVLALELLATARAGGPALLASASAELARLDARTWLTLDVATRAYWYRVPGRSARVEQRLRDATSQPLELVLAAMHPDGRRREVAVARLAEAELDGVPVLPVLALRTADWVAQVRSRARSAFEYRVAHTSPAAITLTVHMALLRRRSAAGRWLFAAVDRLLRKGPAELLAAAMAHQDRAVRRLGYATAVDTDRLSLEQLTHVALTEADLPVRVACARAALRLAQQVGDTATARRLLAGRAATVRAEAINALGAAGDLGPAEAALTDRTRLVRTVAQDVLRRNGHQPVADYRRLALVHQPPPLAVLAGLGETGSTTDAELVLPWLAHPRPRARAEAVRALRRLGAVATESLVPLLADPAPSVVRQATLSLLDQASALNEQLLLELLAPPRPDHVRVAAIRLLRARDTWTRLRTDLALFTDPLPAIRDNARADLASWLSYEAATTYSMPTPERAAELAALLAAVEPTMDAHRVKVLRFHWGLNT